MDGDGCSRFRPDRARWLSGGCCGTDAPWLGFEATLRQNEPVSFFDDAPPTQQPHTPEPRREPWRGTAEDTLGIPVPFADLLARNEEVAVLVSGIVAFPAGFSLGIVLLSRLNPPPQPFAPFVHRYPGTPEVRGPFRFGLGFADGAKLFAERGPWPPMAQGQYTLRPQGGGGGGRSWRQGFLSFFTRRLSQCSPSGWTRWTWAPLASSRSAAQYHP